MDVPVKLILFWKFSAVTAQLFFKNMPSKLYGPLLLSPKEKYFSVSLPSQVDIWSPFPHIAPVVSSLSEEETWW